MFEKIVITILRSFSAVAYVVLMGILFAFPISFFVHAFIPPEFQIVSSKMIEIEDYDMNLASVDEDIENWQRFDYQMTATSGIFSPYDYRIEELTVKNTEILPADAPFMVFIDEPSVFDKNTKDDITVSLYIKSEEEIEAKDLMNIEFKCKVYEKNFEEFDCKYGNGKLWK